MAVAAGAQRHLRQPWGAVSQAGFEPILIAPSGQWVDKEVQVCEGGQDLLITSRNPGDLPAFCSALTAALRATSGMTGSGEEEGC